MERDSARVIRFDLSKSAVRDLNQFLHTELSLLTQEAGAALRVDVEHPDGRHNLAVGVNAPCHIEICGHAGYFVGGMNQQATIHVQGNVGWSVAENIMSGQVRVAGCALECAGASGHGGLIVVEGNASSRCGISMKGCDIVVGGNVGHMSAFMGQAGRMVVCGNAGPNLGDSLYEAVIYVRGSVHSLGTDAREEPMQSADYQAVSDLLSRAGLTASPEAFRRIASARTLYHWHDGAVGHY